jgi:serine/threonine protein kinase
MALTMFKRTDNLTESYSLPHDGIPEGGHRQEYEIPLYHNDKQYRTLNVGGLVPVQNDVSGDGWAAFVMDPIRFDPNAPLMHGDSLDHAANGCPFSTGANRTYFIEEVGDYLLQVDGYGYGQTCRPANIKMQCSGGAETTSPAKSDPLGFSVDKDTGAITGTPERVRDGYKMRLEAVDAGENRITVANWTFNVEGPPVFALNPASGWSMETDGKLESKYHIDETYLLSKPRLTSKDLLQHPANDAFDDIAYLLSVTPDKSNADCNTVDDNENQVFNDVTSGSGALNIKCEGNYTGKLIVRDGAGSNVEVRSWQFEVLPKDPPKFTVVTTSIRVHVNVPGFTDPSDMSFWEVGPTYTIAPLMLDRSATIPSKGAIEDITYTLKGRDTKDWFVHADTGAIMGSFKAFGTTTFDLVAVDAGGITAVVETYNFTVIEIPPFKVLNFTRAANPSNNAGHTDVIYTDPATTSKYAVDTVYEFAPLTITEAENTHDAPHNLDTIRYTIANGPPGFLVNPSTGYIKGSADNVQDFTMIRYAVDSSNNQAKIERITMAFKRNDAATAANGPNGVFCSDFSTVEDTILFDNSFTCSCYDGFEGETCEVNAKAKMAATETAATARSTLLTGVIFGIVIALIIGGVVVYKVHAYKLKMKPVDFEKQFALMVSMGLIEPEHVKVQMKPREIRRKDLTLVKVIGSGAFGEVHKAQLDETFTRSTPEYTVAAKTVLDAKSSPEATKEILAEAGVMAAVGSHPNLVSLIGVITRGDPLVLILQFCAQGELLGMLKKAAAEGEPIALMDKMQMAREVAQGMDHLSKEHFIHRDLACRNVLCSEGMCKIADFGLSRGGGGESTTAENEDAATHEDYYKSTSGVFPVRWTAPEAMETLRFTPASDVWSFGIVVIELLVDGNTPYHGMSNPEVMNLTMSGGRHPKPPLCSNKLYDMLLKCWDADAAKRPAFPTLCDAFKEMYTVSSKSADANAARVEAAANDKMKRGSAANQYSSFAGEFDAAAAATAATAVGQEQVINQVNETSLPNTEASDQPAAHFYPQTN